jgi:excisionase family DNA binding protein
MREIKTVAIHHHACTEGETMLLTVEQAADRLGTSVRFIRRLRTEGRIPVIKLGKHIRIDSTDLDAYINSGRQEAWN